MESAEVVRAFTSRAWNEGRLDEAAELLAPGLIDHDPMPFPGRAVGRDGLLQVVAAIRAAIPDLRRTIELQLVDGELVATSFADEGTHDGPLMGVPATGRRVRVRGINIERVVDGRIVEIRHVEDVAGLMAQITSAPATAGG